VYFSYYFVVLETGSSAGLSSDKQYRLSSQSLLVHFDVSDDLFDEVFDAFDERSYI
jgi:hypothetical protein